MSNKLKLNMKNVILGCHHFGDVLATNRIYLGIPRLAAPSAIDHKKPSKPDLFHRQDYVRRNALNHTEAGLPRGLDSICLKRLSSEVPLVNKRMCTEVHTGRISNACDVLPWESPVGIYYDKKNPQSQPSCNKIYKDCCEPPVPPCPITKSPKYVTKLKCYPRKSKKTNLTKITARTLKTFPLYNCRFYSASRYQPSGQLLSPFKPKFCKLKREVRCGPDPCKPRKRTKNKCGGSGGDPCADVPKAPKECYQTPGKGARSGGAGKKEPICPEAVLPRGFDSISLKRITSEVPLINESIGEVHTGRISKAGGVLPWESPIGTYYDKKNPQSQPSCPKIYKDSCEPPVPPCPIAKSPKYVTKLKCYPRKSKKTNLTKITPCILTTFPLYHCRFYSGQNPCKPRRPSKNKCGGGGSGSGGDPCAGIPKDPKECYQTPGKGARSGGGGVGLKKGPICPQK